MFQGPTPVGFMKASNKQEKIGVMVRFLGGVVLLTNVSFSHNFLQFLQGPPTLHSAWTSLMEPNAKGEIWEKGLVEGSTSLS